MREGRQWACSISDTQTIVGTIDRIAVAIGVVNLVDDLSALFRPETKALNRDAVDQKEIIADEANGWPFGAIGQASGEVSAGREVS